jgi:hypothetical protein
MFVRSVKIYGILPTLNTRALMLVKVVRFRPANYFSKSRCCNDVYGTLRGQRNPLINFKRKMLPLAAHIGGRERALYPPVWLNLSVLVTEKQHSLFKCFLGNRIWFCFLLSLIVLLQDSQGRIRHSARLAIQIRTAQWLCMQIDKKLINDCEAVQEWIHSVCEPLKVRTW